MHARIVACNMACPKPFRSKSAATQSIMLVWSSVGTLGCTLVKVVGGSNEAMLGGVERRGLLLEAAPEHPDSADPGSLRVEGKLCGFDSMSVMYAMTAKPKGR